MRSICAKLISFSLLASGFIQGATIFYHDKPSFGSGISVNALSNKIIDFESLSPGDYSTPQGVSIEGATFVGEPAFQFELHVFPESTWGHYFAAGTGNTIAAVWVMSVALPANTRAFGANVGESFVWATGRESIA